MITQMRGNLGAFFLLIFFNHFLSAQINTPSTGTFAPTVPFGSLIAASANPYGNGMVPTNLPSGAYTPASNLYGKSQDAYTYYNTWKAYYRNACGGTPAAASIKTETAGKSYSESIGYAMLITVYAADKAFFDELWQYYKLNRNCRGLMGWRRNLCSTSNAGGSGDDNGATDGDLDVAMALIVATCQWPAAVGANTTTDPHNYKTDALALLDAIRKYEIDYVTAPVNQISNGDGWLGYGTNCNPANMGNACRNPSYMAPGYLRQFALFQPAQAATWNNVLAATNTLLTANRNATTGLVSSWCDPNGVANGCNGPNEYGYDACRNPWRMATDVLWHGTGTAPVAYGICDKTSTWINTSEATMGGPVAQNAASPSGTNHIGCFVGPWSVGTMGATVNAANQTRLNNCYTSTKNLAETVDDAHYFSNTLKTISLFEMTGNFWKPGPCPVLPPSCRQPALGPDFSTCGSSFPYTLNSNTPTATGVTFTWKRITPSATTLVAASSTQNTFSVTSAMGAGTYAVIRDSTGGCTQSDTIVISSTLLSPVISPAGPINLCNPASINFTVSNAASFPAGTTWQWYNGTGTTLITGSTSTSLSNVRTAATYKVVASIGGCTSTFDQEVVTSSLPTPVDGCASSGNIPLSITNAGTGPYQWYNVATGGVSLGAGTSYSAATPGTYYVQDMSAVSLVVGPTTSLSTPGGANGYSSKGASTGQLLNFTTKTANVTINYVTVYVITYAATSLNFTIQLYDNSGTAISTGGSPSTAVFTGVAASNPSYTAIRVPVNITIPTAGNYKLGIGMGAGDNGNMWYYQGGTAPSWASYTSSALDITGNTSTANDYSFMYKWEISTGTACARLPVIASNTGCTTSPVKLISFYASNESNDVVLNWSTATEKDNDYFLIERSTDGFTFMPIGKVKGGGNSNSILFYSFTDPQPVFGNSYYRLVQYDFNETHEYSQVIALTRTDKTSIGVLPNPFNQYTDLVVHSDAHEKMLVTITDLRGQVVYRSEAHYTNEAIQVGSEFASGMYIVQVVVNGRLYHSKIIKGF